MMLLFCLAVHLLCSLCAAQELDPFISNGTCYFKRNEEASSNFVPCGNSAYEVYSCCQARDTCLSSNACYNAQYGVTYLAGCTDPEYNDDVCPYKGFYPLQEWTGLVRCYASNDTDSQDEAWTSCPDGSQPLLGPPDQCSCRRGATVVFYDSPVLTNIAVLPLSAGDHISWFKGYTPTFSSTIVGDPVSTGSSTATTSSTSTSSMSLTTSASSTVSVPSTSVSVSMSGSATALVTIDPSTGSLGSPTIAGAAASSTSQPLSTGTKVGIGVGSAGAAVLVGAAIISLILWLRRRRGQEKEHQDNEIKTSGISPRAQALQSESGEKSRSSWTKPRSILTKKNQNGDAVGSASVTDSATAADPNLRSLAWSGYKSELPADDPLTVRSGVLPAPFPAQSLHSDTGSNRYRGHSAHFSHDSITSPTGFLPPTTQAQTFHNASCSPVTAPASAVARDTLRTDALTAQQTQPPSHAQTRSPSGPHHFSPTVPSGGHIGDGSGNNNGNRDRSVNHVPAILRPGSGAGSISPSSPAINHNRSFNRDTSQTDLMEGGWLYHGHLLQQQGIDPMRAMHRTNDVSDKYNRPDVAGARSEAGIRHRVGSEVGGGGGPIGGVVRSEGSGMRPRHQEQQEREHDQRDSSRRGNNTQGLTSEGGQRSPQGPTTGVYELQA